MLSEIGKEFCESLYEVIVPFESEENKKNSKRTEKGKKILLISQNGIPMVKRYK